MRFVRKLYAAEASARIATRRLHQAPASSCICALQGSIGPTASRSPSGGDARPSTLYPQQTGLPSFRNAQVWDPPLLSDVNLSLGGGNAGFSSSSNLLMPQQATLPEVRRAQVCPPPSLINANRSPSGGDPCRKILHPSKRRFRWHVTRRCGQNRC